MTAKPPVVRIHYRDPDEGWEGVLVLDSLVDGKAAGGVRLSRTVDADEVCRLARAMTLKMRALQLPVGGAKAGIRYDPKATNRVDAMTRFFQHVKPICEQMYGFGPDMNTSPEELDEVARRIGLTSRHVALSSGRGESVNLYHRILAERIGPLTINEARTGIGVSASVERSAALFGIKTPLKIAVQGFGQVGASSAWFLSRAGHRIVGVADEGGYYHREDGLDIGALIAARGENRMIAPDNTPPGVRRSERDSVLKEACDVLVLAATKDVVTEANQRDVQAKVIVEGGNLAVTDAATALLHGRGVMVVPDFLASAGAIGVVVGVIRLGWPYENPEQFIRLVGDHVGGAVERAVRSALSKNVTVREAALIDLGIDLATKR